MALIQRYYESREYQSVPANAAEAPAADDNSSSGGPVASLISGASNFLSEDHVVLGITVPSFVVKILLGVLAIFALILIIGFILLHNEKKEARARAKRRAQRLHHTKDLTRKQSMDIDMMIQNKVFEKPRRRGRRK